MSEDQTIEKLSEWEIPGRRLLVRQETAEEITKGGIILPDTARNDLMTAVVVKVGTGVGPRIAASGFDGGSTTARLADRKAPPRANAWSVISPPDIGDRVLCSKDALRSGTCKDVFGVGYYIIVWETADGDDGDVLAISKKGSNDADETDTTEG